MGNIEVERVVQVRADFALFSRSDSGRDKLTYQFPTPGALRGYGASQYHCPRLEFVPLKVEVLKPIQIVSAMRTYLSNAVYDPNDDVRVNWKNGGGQKGYGGPASTLYLHDVEYRITYKVSGPSKDIKRLDRRLEVGAFCNPPYLGTRECLAVPLPVDDKPPIDVTFFEPAMCLSNNGPDVRVDCIRGVVTYPRETALALRHRRRERRDFFMPSLSVEEYA